MRTLSALLVCLALASPIHAQERVSPKLYAAFLGMSSVNETLTLVNMSRGYHETNPAYPTNSKAGHIATFAAFQALDFYALKRLEQSHPKMAKFALIALLGVQGSVTVWEAHNLR